MSLYVEVALPIPLRKTFTYSVPNELESITRIGIRVYVPFNNRYTIGLVVALKEEKPAYKTKPVKEILDKIALLDTTLFKLADWIHRYYFCSFGEAAQAMLPVGFNFQSVKYIKPARNLLLSGNPIVDDFLKDVFDSSKSNYAELLTKHRLVTAKDLEHLIVENKIEIWEEPKLKSQVAKENVWNWNGEGKEKARQLLADVIKKMKWQTALQTLLETNLPAKSADLDVLGINRAALKKIESLGIIQLEQREKIYDEQTFIHKPENLRTLNEEQFTAYDHIKDYIIQSIHRTILLKGITGSGKTEVYIHAIKTCLEVGKGAIVLVPEIALTPQTVRRFYEIFGDKIAVLHSRLTDQEKLYSWNELKNGEKMIAIGPRSAVFAPVQQLGLIIVDEEHDSSYRQEDPAPRYHGRDTAIMRAYLEQIPIVLGSATPSLTSWKSVQDGKFDLLELNSRQKGSVLPEVELCDLTQYKKAMYGPLTAALFLAINEALGRKEQIILLLNRRGYSPYLLCSSCGSIQECPNCSVSLTYHKPKRMFMCHYCGYSRFEKTACSKCNHADLQFVGAGTQKIEEEIESLFPHSRVLRMDQDTTRGKHSHRDLIEAFRKKEYDILIGTQLVSKGLDFPEVTVVGVLNTDTELAFPSYKAQERLFQLMSQVAGRSGRAQKRGKVWLQSWKPDKYALHAAKKHNYEEFAIQEMEYRKQLQYPPFSKLIQFIFKGKHAEETGSAAQLFFQCLIKIIPEWPILGPAPSTIHKIEREYFWDILLKMHPTIKTGQIEKLLDLVFALYDEEREKKFNSVRVNVKVDY